MRAFSLLALDLTGDNIWGIFEGVDINPTAEVFLVEPVVKFDKNYWLWEDC